MELKLSGFIGGTAAAVAESIWDAGAAVLGAKSMKDWATGVPNRAAGRLPLPENHDLVYTIRVA